MIFRRPWGLTNCASHGTLAKLTRPGGVYKVLEHIRLRGIYEVTVRYLESICGVLFSITIAIENH